MNNRIKVGHKGDIQFCLTSGQTTPLGKLLFLLHYSTLSNNILSLIKNTGYPHNGGEHGLTVYGTAEEIESFFDIIVETYMNRGCDDALHAIMFFKSELKAYK